MMLNKTQTLKEIYSAVCMNEMLGAYKISPLLKMRANLLVGEKNS